MIYHSLALRNKTNSLSEVWTPWVLSSLSSTSRCWSMTDVLVVGVYFAAVMIMCTISVMMTVLVLNLHHRKPDMYKMSPWVLQLLLLLTTTTAATTFFVISATMCSQNESSCYCYDVHPSVRPSVHLFSADLSSQLDSPMFWAGWHQSVSTCSQPSFFSFTWKTGCANEAKK